MSSRTPRRAIATLFLLVSLAAHGQEAGPAKPETAAPPEFIASLFREALLDDTSYQWLRELTTRHPGRLSGSRSLEGAITWAVGILNGLQFDEVRTQDVQVPHWERGAAESVSLLLPGADPIHLHALALGNSAASPEDGVTGRVVIAHSLVELEQLGQERVEGRIVFFNGRMDASLVQPGTAYGRAVAQRSRGPAAASKLGARATLVRSLTLAPDDVPHTGNTGFPPGVAAIPALALGFRSADRLAAALAGNPEAEVTIQTHCRTLPDALSHNVIAEIRGSEFPNKIILVGGHIDSWDNTPGAHDDGAGVVQSIEVFRLLMAQGFKPRHTLRCVLFTNEENGLRGAIAYAAAAKERGELHVLAIETDSGGFAPRGFELGSTQGPVHELAAKWKPLFDQYGFSEITAGNGGADVTPLLVQGATVGNLRTDPHRYFDFHHTSKDTIEAVHPRELALGAAGLAALVYLVDTEGL